MKEERQERALATLSSPIIIISSSIITELSWQSSSTACGQVVEATRVALAGFHLALYFTL
jgi:hypothetical protein